MHADICQTRERLVDLIGPGLGSFHALASILIPLLFSVYDIPTEKKRIKYDFDFSFKGATLN